MTEPITIHVPHDLAEAYRSAPPERQRKMALYMALRLKAYGEASDLPFEEIWTRLGKQAEARGLTEEKLEALLREIDEEREAEREARREAGRGAPDLPLGDGYGDGS